MSATTIAPPLPLAAEIARQVRRRRTIGIFIVLAVLPLVLLLAFWLGNDSSETGERGFVDLAQDSGANLVIFTLFASTSFLLIVIVALFAGDTVPSEASWASLRYLLAAPVRRERLLRQKLIVATLSSLVALVFLPAWTLVVGGIAYGWGPYVGPTGTQIGWPEFAGRLGAMVDARWFDPVAMTAAGNVSAFHIQSGFLALAPTDILSKWIGLADKAHDEDARAAFVALETWARDNVAFPASAYVTYIKELYQENRLVRGDHWVRGERVDLSRITCPTLAIVAERDGICPPRAVTAMHDATRASVKDVLSVPGGHVGAVVGSRAARELYPKLRAWLEKHAVV